jgi:hypothetical protein
MERRRAEKRTKIRKNLTILTQVRNGKKIVLSELHCSLDTGLVFFSGG